jgi:hypothetical protein
MDEFFKALGFELLPWQREIMDRIASLPADRRVIVWPARGSKLRSNYADHPDHHRR